MTEKGEDMDKSVSDVETVRQTLESLDLAGTAEAADAVEQSIQGAEGVSVGEFDEKATELEGIHQEGQEHESELQERSDSTSADLGRISDASGRINSDAANNELVAAKESGVRDMEFLEDNLHQAQDAREESRRLEEEYRARIDAGGGA